MYAIKIKDIDGKNYWFLAKINGIGYQVVSIKNPLCDNIIRFNSREVAAKWWDDNKKAVITELEKGVGGGSIINILFHNDADIVNIGPTTDPENSRPVMFISNNRRYVVGVTDPNTGRLNFTKQYRSDFYDRPIYRLTDRIDCADRYLTIDEAKEHALKAEKYLKNIDQYDHNKKFTEFFVKEIIVRVDMTDLSIPVQLNKEG